MKDPKLHTMSTDMMDIMIRDWLADNPDTADCLNVHYDTIKYDDDIGCWTCESEDNKYCYTLVAYDGSIDVRYSGTK